MNYSEEISLILLIGLGVVLSLISTSLTLFTLDQLLAPLILTKSSLSEYISDKKLPRIPTQFNDELGELMRQIHYSINSLDELHKEKKDLVSLLSLDLRNNMTAVYNFSEMIPNLNTEEEKLNLREKIKNSSKASIETIDSVVKMLDLEEIVVTDSMKKEIELNEMLNSIKENFADEIHRKQLSLEFYLDIKFIKGKEALLKQALTNIVSNAIKYSHMGGKIEIRTAKNGINTLINIIDYGVGFANTNKEKIFDRFTQLRTKGTLGEAANGLGLYLTKKIIERHSGLITAKSKGKGKGAEFTVTLPD